jgi:NADH:ubiquinone oxidoreductase subunit 3 (subunit A)
MDAYETVVTVESLTPSYSSQLYRLGHASRVYVTANLLLSFLSEESGGFITITAGQPGAANAISVTTNCATQTACSSATVLPSTICALNIDVTDAITPQSGGTLLLTASSDVQEISGATPTLCNRQGQSGIYFEIDYTVSTYLQPTQRPTPAPTHAPTTGFLISLNSKGLATTGGAPFYVVAFAAAAYTALGVLLVRLHDNHEKLTPHSLLSVCSDLALQGYGLVSEVFLIVLLFQAQLSSFSAMAIVLIVTRLSNLGVTAFLLRRVFPPVDSVSPYNNLYHKDVLFDNAKLYAFMLLLMTLDVSTFRYFPWLDTDFAFRTAGFPDMLSFQMCMATKVVTALVSLVVQAVVLGSLNESGINNKYTLALFIMYLIATIVMFVITCLTLGMQIRLLRLAAEEALHERDTSGSRSSSFQSGNPLHDHGAIELGAMRTLGATRGTAASSFWRDRESSTANRASNSTAGGEDIAAAAASRASGRQRRAGGEAVSEVPVLEGRVAQLTQELQDLRTTLQAVLDSQRVQADMQQAQMRELADSQRVQADIQQAQMRELLERLQVFEGTAAEASTPAKP